MAKLILDPKKVAPVIGTEVTDKLSGYVGSVRGVRIHNSGCINVLLQKPGLNLDKTPYMPIWMEFTGLVGFKKLPQCEKPEILGQKVRDRLTEYEGTAVSIALYDNSDARVHIQGKTRTDEGIPSPEHICDLMDIERLDAKPVAKTTGTGAPAFIGRAVSHTLR
jgi:hypothetical protein